MTRQPLERPTESPFRIWDFVIVMALTFGAAAVGSVVALIVSPPDELTTEGLLSDPMLIGISLVFQLLGTFAGLAVVKAIRRASIEDFGLPITGSDASGILWGLGFLVPLLGVGLLVETLDLEAPSGGAGAALGGMDNPWFAIGAVLAIGVFGPLAEELTYRAVLQGSLRRRFAPITAILITSLVFAPLHIQAGPGVTVFILIALIFALSIMLGWLVERDGGRIGRAFFAHATYNSMQVLAVLVGLAEV
ncbi:MAG: CPBP family intramembrane glutamic endopeptidase [Acidimicrobiia bacterium]